MRVLIIEDEADIAANVGDFLELQGHRCDFASDGISGMHLALTTEVDVIVLDVNLPGMNGLDFARRLREDARRATPILMLTARDTVDDRVDGLSAGADDYLVKPFALRELEARLESLYRRSHQDVGGALLRVGDLEFDPQQLKAQRGQRRIELTPIPRKLLEALLRANGRVISREELESLVWGEELPEGDALRVHIHALRKALHGAGEIPLLHTIRGAGYRLAVDDPA